MELFLWALLTYVVVFTFLWVLIPVSLSTTSLGFGHTEKMTFVCWWPFCLPLLIIVFIAEGLRRLIFG